MKVTLNWLKEFVDVSATPEDIADKLTLAGMEVEEIIKQDKYIDHVRIGRVLEINQHPNADKLTVCKVDLGTEIVQIITSAKNIKVGDLVPVSLPGANLANGIEIKPSEMRGVKSDGMFCSGEELGIGEETYVGASLNQILVFHDDIKEGTYVADFLGMNDVIFDVNITANRPDCNSVIGIAKELAAIYHLPFKAENFDYVCDKDDRTENYVDVEVVNTDLCPRYIACAVKNVVIKKSPCFIASRLSAVGIKSINNIVDITNYVLIEYGQPMHAFDQKHLEGNKIVVRNAKQGEKIKCLDNNEYSLDESVLAICDQNKPVVIAGVIGGVNSCVEDNTSTVIFESACFERKSIRVTSRRFGIRTDSSARFERGVDIGSQLLGMKKALKLINLTNSGTVVSNIIDRCATKIENRTVICSLNKIEKILGVKIPDENILSILNSLGIKSSISMDELKCIVSPERFDIECDNDVAEELIRFYGYGVYDDINKPVLSETQYTIGKNDIILAEQNILESMLVDFGFYQAVNYSMAPSNHAKMLGISDEKMVVISNPLSEDLSVMRLNLAHGLLTNVAFNINHANKNFKLFEFGRTYQKHDKNNDELPDETNMLAMVISKENEDFYTLKGIIEKILETKQLATRVVRSSLGILHPGKSADIIDLQSKNVIASFGEINPHVASSYDIPTSTLYGEINVDILSQRNDKRIAVKAISKFPIVQRDLAVVADEKVTADDILSVVKKSCGEYFAGAEIFDIYRSEQLGKSKKSVAFNFKLSSLEKTLKDDETNNIVSSILKDLSQKYGASLR